MIKKVRDYIAENRMIEPGDVILTGVSGGGDSMAMLSLLHRLMKELDFSLCAVHVHHGIRGKEADRDLHLVEEACRKLEIPCRAYFYDVPKLSGEWKTGHEETGRIVRKEAFQKTGDFYRKQGKNVKTALAHNQEDLAETMLHNLSRGTGIRGLATMRPVSGEIIRPVLCLGRREIAHYLRENQIACIIDSTNLSDEYTRNRIRHHILPLLEQEINIQAAAHMAETAGRLADAEDYLCAKGRELLERYALEDNGYLFTESFFEAEKILKTYALQQAFETLAGRRKDFAAVHLKKVLEMGEMQTGRCISLPYGLWAEKKYTGVFLGKKQQAFDEKNRRQDDAEELWWEIPIPGRLQCAFGTLETRIFSYEGQKIEEKKCTKWLDYDRMICSPCIRTRRAGDYLIVNSEGNRKKLNRCMIDGKVPRELRDRIPLIACEDEVLWMVGYRLSEKYKIKPDTKRVLEITIQ